MTPTQTPITFTKDTSKIHHHHYTTYLHSTTAMHNPQNNSFTKNFKSIIYNHFKSQNYTLQTNNFTIQTIAIHLLPCN